MLPAWNPIHMREAVEDAADKRGLNDEVVLLEAPVHSLEEHLIQKPPQGLPVWLILKPIISNLAWTVQIFFEI